MRVFVYTQCQKYKTISKIQVEFWAGYCNDEIKPKTCFQFDLALAFTSYYYVCDTFIKAFHIKVNYRGNKCSFLICGPAGTCTCSEKKNKVHLMKYFFVVVLLSLIL